MQLKYTPSTLDKIENLIINLGYIVRYEKGNFQSGYCILEHKKILVINKFLNIESRINILIEILNEIEVNPSLLTDEYKKLYNTIIKPVEDAVLF